VWEPRISSFLLLPVLVLAGDVRRSSMRSQSFQGLEDDNGLDGEALTGGQSLYVAIFLGPLEERAPPSPCSNVHSVGSVTSSLYFWWPQLTPSPGTH
jgi:hypothetical protein